MNCCMHKQSGYLMIELLMYCAIVVFIAAITFECAVTQHSMSIKREARELSRAQIAAAQSLLARDIQQLVAYKKRDENEYVFSFNDYHVIWSICDNKLLRIQSGCRAVLAQGVRSLVIESKENNLIAVNIVTDRDEKSEWCIHTLNGVGV